MLNITGGNNALTCTELLLRAAGSSRAVSFHDDFDAPRRVEFGALHAAALTTLGRLQEHGLKAGDTMLLIVPRN